MGSLASGIFGLIEGDPTATEEGELGDLSGYETNTGEGATTAANDYYGGILSGDPAEVAKTLAPEISTATGEAQQKKQTNAEFGNRSGGTNATNQSIDTGTRGDIINLEGTARQNAAGAEAGLGTNLLSQATPNITADAGLKRQQNTAESGDIGGIVQGAAQIASGLFGGGGGIPGIGDTAAEETPGADFGSPSFNPDLGMPQEDPAEFLYSGGAPSMPDVNVSPY